LADLVCIYVLSSRITPKVVGQISEILAIGLP